MHSMDIPGSPIRPEASGGHPNGGGVALAPTPHGLPASLLLHLGPGLVVGAAYLALIPAARALGLPSVAAIGAQALLVTCPLMIGILKVSSRRRRPGEPAIALRRVPPVRATLGWATLIICAAAAAFVLTRPIIAWLESTLFEAWPDSWKPQLGTAGGYSDSALLWTAVLVLVGSVLVAPVVEEAYFRGFLLPRMPTRLGRSAPLAHAVLFAF
jgi:membrane protease YdiL (CAAX protease family)